MHNVIAYPTDGTLTENLARLRELLAALKVPYRAGDSIGIKLHWGERGNKSFLPPEYAREIVAWLSDMGMKPFIFDTTVLYSGYRRTAEDSLATAADHGYSEDYLGCPVIIGDGADGQDVVDIEAAFTHFETVQVASLIESTDGFFIFSHFKGHLEAGFGGAIKNLSMGFASRAQKQRMHSDAHPVLNETKCTKCGLCVKVCPTKAAEFPDDDAYPVYDLDLCIGCAQCIAMCPEVALKIFWDTDITVFQEKLVETAAAVWKRIAGRTLLVNALFKITADCDCMPGKNPVIARDMGLLSGYDPVALDRASLDQIGSEVFRQTHPGVPWDRQFEYAKEIGFGA